MPMERHASREGHAGLIFLLNCYDVWSATPPRPGHCPAPGLAPDPADPGPTEQTP